MSLHEPDLTTTMKIGIKQKLLSAAVFAGILFALASVDERVHDRFRELLSGGGLSPWTGRLTDLVGAVGGAVRNQSIENAPIVVFAAVSAVLVLFMWRT